MQLTKEPHAVRKYGMSLKILRESSAADKHASNVSDLAAVESNILSCSNDGQIKLWSSDLKLIKEVTSVSGGILSMTVATDAIYTCCSDGTIQIWDKYTLQNVGQVQTTLVAPQKVFVEPKTNSLWAGDSVGAVAKYDEGKQTEKYELVEEVWDLIVTSNPDLLITARDRDIVVAEIVKGNLRNNAVVKATIPGRYPITIVGDIFCCLDRDGRGIKVCENNLISKFKLLKEIPASEMILNCLSGSGSSEVYTGGYDSKIAIWNVNLATSQGSVDVNSCVNSFQVSTLGAYTALADGRILLVGR